MVTHMPFLIMVTFLSFDSLFGILGIILAVKKIEGAPFITMFAGILSFGMLATVQQIDLGYTQADIANTTETGGTSTCSTSGGVTTCTVSNILKTFSYKNSTNQYTNNPDGIPSSYSIFQENIWIFFVLLGSFWIALALMIQLAKWY